MQTKNKMCEATAAVDTDLSKAPHTLVRWTVRAKPPILHVFLTSDKFPGRPEPRVGSPVLLRRHAHARAV